MSVSTNQFWRSPTFRTAIILVIIFLIAFILRVIYPISRPLVWSDRAFHFIDAIIDGDFARTYQRYHPGVTIMWLSGIALQIFSLAKGGFTADQMLGVEPTKPGTLIDALQFSVIPVALVIAASIALLYVLLRRLAGPRIGFAGALLVALDPFYIGYSKVIHPDALLATFMLVSAMFLLLYVKEDRWLMLVLSGLFGGLSFLSKSPSLFLIPYTGLIIGASTVVRWHQGRSAQLERRWTDLFWYALRSLLIWAGVSVALYVLLWPVMWVRPLAALEEVVDGILHHRADPHRNPVFFNNQIWTTDPGVGFYLATILWKTTAITLPAILAGLVFAIRRYRLPESWPFWALFAYVFFFTIQMALSSFKQIAYILPVFPALSLLAGFGLIWLAEAIGRLRPFSHIRSLDVAIIGIALTLQAIIVLTSYPYFGARNNLLLGGTQVAKNILPQQDQGEGLEVAARFLNSLPHNQDEIAQIFPRSAIVFRREFEGRTTSEISPFARYRIYYYNQLVRELGDEEWHSQWEEDKKTDPLLVVDVGGIPQVWVYGDVPEDPAAGGPSFELDYQLGDHIRLNQAKLNQTNFRAGDPLVLVLYWESDGQIENDYTVFAHIIAADGTLAAQQDNIPLFGIRPTTTWRDQEEMEDPIFLRTDEALKPGSYQLSVGMYNGQTLQRLPVFDGQGNRVKEDRIIIGELQIAGGDE